MSIKLYMNHNVPKQIAEQLRSRQVDVLTAFEDGTHELSDPDLLDRATELERVLFSQDDDLLAEAALRQANDTMFYGVIYAHQRNASIGECVTDLEMIAKVCDPSDVIKDVMYLPLR